MARSIAWWLWRCAPGMRSSPSRASNGLRPHELIAASFRLPLLEPPRVRARPILLPVICVAVFAMSGPAAHASPSCVKERTPFALSGDTVTWTMSIAPGADCIQGLRLSYMQIFSVSVVSGPSRGQLKVVGSGFRYLADNQARGPDKFTLLISGKNGREAGTSTLEVEVNPQ